MTSGDVNKNKNEEYSWQMVKEWLEMTDGWQGRPDVVS